MEVYQFNPNSFTITTLQLAMIMRAIPIRLPGEAVSKMHPNLQEHFQYVGDEIIQPDGSSTIEMPSEDTPEQMQMDLETRLNSAAGDTDVQEPEGLTYE